MARTRHVFPSSQVVHLWAHQTQDSARNAQSNLSFDGDKLTSYGHYCIARIINRKGKGKLVLIQSNKYSNTTAKQINEAESAITHLQSVHVPALTDSYYDSDKLDAAGYATRTLDHRRNLSHFKREIEALQASIKSSRVHTSYLFDRLDSLIKEANIYSKYFSLRVKFKSIYSDAQRIEMESIADERARVAEAKRSAKYKVERELAEIAYRKRQEARIPDATKLMDEWLTGGGSFGNYAISDASRILNRTALRIVGENVQTSMGVEFPIAHAILGLALVRKTVASGIEWRTNGHTLHLGHFKIDHISADGTVKAGCHTVTLAEIERIAPELDKARESRNWTPAVNN